MRAGKVCLVQGVLVAAMLAQPGGWQETIRQGHLLQRQGHWPAAEAAFQKAFTEAAGQPDAARWQARALADLSSLRADQGNASDAARLSEQAANLLARTAGEDDGLLQDLRMDLAEMYLSAGEADTGEHLFRQVLSAQTKVSQTQTRQHARVLIGLAEAAAWRGNLGPAEKSLRQALSILENYPNSGARLAAIGNLHLAAIQNSKGRDSEGLDSVTRAERFLRLDPFASPAMLSEAAMLRASLCIRAGCRNESEADSAHAVEIDENYYGREHVLTAWTILARAAVLRRLGRTRESQAAQQEGARILAGLKRRELLHDTVPLNALVPVH